MMLKYFGLVTACILTVGCADEDKSPNPGASPTATPASPAPSPVPLLPAPIGSPSTLPSVIPTPSPTASVSPVPSVEPSAEPTLTPAPTPSPTALPTATATALPTTTAVPTPSPTPILLNGVWDWVDTQCSGGEFTAAGRVLALDIQKILKAKIVSRSLDLDGKLAVDKEISDRGECVFSAPFALTSLGANAWEIAVESSNSPVTRACGSKPAQKKTLELRGDSLIEFSAADPVKCTSGPFATVYQRN